jgi:hypothetical protein
MKESEYWEALGRYQKMLDNFGILPNVQQAAWEKILELNPEEAIRIINKYSEEIFGDQGNSPREKTSPGNFPNQKGKPGKHQK